MRKYLCLIITLSTAILNAQAKTSCINPFIGTCNLGHTFPGAVLPWGMVSVSPHTAPGAPSGYMYGNPFFYGFGMNHLSGTGCADLGSIIVTADTGITDDAEIYKMEYSGESAKAGYYSLIMNRPGIRTEVSSTQRCGIFKFTALKPDRVYFYIDAGKSLAITGGGSLTVYSDTDVQGRNISGGFCGENNRQTVYFAARFSKPFLKSGILSSGKTINSCSYDVSDSTLVGWFAYDMIPGDTLLLKIALSYTSIKNALANLESEMPGWNFNEVVSAAENSWIKTLDRIQVQDKNDSNKTIFYTALYHMLIHPSIISDVNGDYPLMGRKGMGNNKNRPRYSVFSLWDTYRTLHPFLTLVYPEVQSDIIKTMIDMYKENGFLPKWELISNETYMMVGDPAVPVIADSYIKGISDFDTLAALHAMLKPVMIEPGESAPPIRAGYHEMLQYKYIPFEQDWSTDWWVWGPVSTTQEYCFSDWCISRFAKKMNNNKIHKEFLSRSLYYKNLYDPSTMFFRPKMKNGTWLTPFDSLTLEGSGDWHWSGGPGYVEGNAWTYAWFVPHDVKGLIKLYGEKKFAARLEQFFNQKHFTIGNEPDIHYPYLFRYIKGKEYRTPGLIRQIMNDNFRTGADGMPGDDDCGAISAWYVFSALGFYPVCPGSEDYAAGIPLFDKVIIRLNNKYYKGSYLIIEKQSDSGSDIFMGGKRLPDMTINHFELTAGKKLLFK